MSMFYVGQKVVCVDAEGAPMLRLREIYTVSGVDNYPDYWRGKWIEFGIWLVEAQPVSEFRSFAYKRFRPLVERKTDISMFTAILDKAKVPA
ncbi:MAG: hypothetical protein EPN91_05525 [Salinibacterium sp.]|nr:MAG: hypothetical protein EPN91_05525 [Salinibacterium sp.]